MEFFEVNAAELVDLIHEARPGREPLDIAFGPLGNTALRWDISKPMPWFIERLGLMRGVLNENCQGAGI